LIINIGEFCLSKGAEKYDRDFAEVSDLLDELLATVGNFLAAMPFKFNALTLDLYLHYYLFKVIINLRFYGYTKL